MTTLPVPATQDFSGDPLSDITAITFGNAIHTVATATFANSQFDDVKIKDDVTLIGTSGNNNIVVNGGSVDASGWQFTGWNAAADGITLNGSVSVDTIIGSSEADTLFGGNDPNF